MIITKSRLNNHYLTLLALLMLFTASCNDKRDDVVFTSLTGVYECHENSVHSGFRSYLVEMDKVTGQDHLYIILNFHNSGDNEFIFALVDNDTLRIDNQLINSMFVSGKGKISDDLRTIELFYITDDGRTQLEFFSRIFR
jgi:hypothetical protein